MFIALSVVLLSACNRDPRCPEDDLAMVCDGAAALSCDRGRLIEETPCGAGSVCTDGSGCVSCELDLPASAVAPIDTDPIDSPEPWRTRGWRALSLDGGGAASLSLSGPFEVFDDGGAPITSIDLPATVFLRAIGGGTGSLDLSIEGCDRSSSIELLARTDPGLSVTPRAAGAPVSFVDAFPTGSTVRIALDPIRDRDHIDQPGTLYIVADRDRDEWLTDPSLVDIHNNPLSLQMSGAGLAEDLYDVWVDATAEPGLPGRYDLVIDYDDDGLLGPGDLIDGLDGPGFVVMPDLSEPGPFTPEVANISASFYLTERVYWPLELITSDEPAPLIVISHGNGHEYTWYDYLGEHLASWGYVVMAHRNNTAPGVQAAASTTLSNTDAFVRNHAEIDPGLVGKVDINRIVWIGHSRGGEGILIAHDRLRNNTADVSALSAEDVVLLSTISPTVFESPRTSSPGNVPLHMVTGSADGDVTGGVGNSFGPGPCPLCQWWRLTQDGTADNHITYLHGSTHNDFNCCGPNDGFGVDAPKLGRIETQRYTRALYVALLRYELGGEQAFGEYLRRMPDDLGLPLPATGLVATQSRIARTGQGLFIEDFQVNDGDPSLSSSGTAVRTDLSAYLEGRLDDGDNRFVATDADPMNGMTQSHNDPPAIAARGAVFEWDGPGFWEVDLPEDARDISIRTHLALRVAQATRHPNTTALADTLAFSVALVDGTGAEVVLPTAAYGRVTAPYPRGSLGAGLGWANEFNTVRIRLVDFEALGADLSDVRTIRLLFGPDYGSPVGRLGLDDVALEDR